MDLEKFLVWGRFNAGILGRFIDDLEKVKSKETKKQALVDLVVKKLKLVLQTYKFAVVHEGLDLPNSKGLYRVGEKKDIREILAILEELIKIGFEARITQIEAILKQLI